MEAKDVIGKYIIYRYKSVIKILEAEEIVKNDWKVKFKICTGEGKGETITNQSIWIGVELEYEVIYDNLALAVLNLGEPFHIRKDRE